MNRTLPFSLCAWALCDFLVAAVVLSPALAQPQVEVTTSESTTAILPVANPCPRMAAGSVVDNPPALFSQGGVLGVKFSYQTVTDSAGRTLFCFMTPDGMENPTLHVNPGDRLVIQVTNNTPAGKIGMTINPPNCGATQMTSSSVNIHYHGTNTSPACRQDEVIRTLINSGQTFTYNLLFPANEPPGLYWYHPHVHGIAENAGLGGAPGVIVVEGIENIQPIVSGLRQRILVIRDQNRPNQLKPTGNIPSWDVSLNYVPITSPTSPGGTNWVPAVVTMKPGERQFWRVCNCAADTILDLQLQFDGAPQPILLVGIDGVPVNSQEGTQPGQPISVTHFRLPPASRVEFVASAPPAGVKLAQLVTLGIQTGTNGDNDPLRPLATIQFHPIVGEAAVQEKDATVGSFTALNPNQKRFSGLESMPVAVVRTLYFSENSDQTQFYITVNGQQPKVFDPNAPAAIVTRAFTVEQWTIQNRSQENHEFHIHQTHFLVQSQNNFEINGYQQAPGIKGQFLDTIEIPTWDGYATHPYPSVTVLMDFRATYVGEFVYHCHILNHEDQGMMAIIKVLQPLGAGKGTAKKKPASNKTSGPTKDKSSRRF